MDQDRLEKLIREVLNGIANGEEGKKNGRSDRCFTVSSGN